MDYGALFDYDEVGSNDYYDGNIGINKEKNKNSTNIHGNGRLKGK